MIQKLSIKNYKSLRNVELDCKKLNVFIGEPNSGKSNIIEALSLMSQGIISTERESKEISKDLIRYNNVGDLFFDFNINRPIEVITDGTGYRLKYAVRNDSVPENQFHFEVLPDVSADNPAMRIGHSGMILGMGKPIDTMFRFYEYKRLRSFTINYYPHLAPPYGDNLPSLLLSNEEYRNWVEEFFESKGFTLTLRPAENGVSMSKVVNKSIYSYPYQAISETLQRVVFYMMAIMSNQKSVLLFDEPDSNTFPFYTGFMGESIALDETNQFFLTTHNPYLLLGLIEKSKTTEINVCVVSMKDYETKVTVLNEAQLSEVLDLNTDVFLNLDRIID
jgi:hypothetical protein